MLVRETGFLYINTVGGNINCYNISRRQYGKTYQKLYTCIHIYKGNNYYSQKNVQMGLLQHSLQWIKIDATSTYWNTSSHYKTERYVVLWKDVCIKLLSDK